MACYQTFVGACVDRIKINAISREVRDGRVVWIKRRRRRAAPIVAAANRFFLLAGNPVQVLTDLPRWQRWEVDCFHGLHGDRFRAFADGDRGVGADEMPGISLTVPLDDGSLEPTMVAEAAWELRRAHGWKCAEMGGTWSHGDPHLGNFIFDRAERRARLIDFEVMHDPALSADERHADDLLVFLQDMVGRIAADRWLPNAHAFLDAYARPEIVAILLLRLVLPVRLFPRLWWKVRTTFLPAGELAARLAALRDSI